MATRKRNSGSGLSIGGNVRVNNGDFVGGNKSIHVGNGGSYIGGDVKGSTVVTGNGNQVGKFEAARQALFDEINKKIDAKTELPAVAREDLKATVEEIKTEAAKGKKADETFLARRLRNLEQMAPDILQVVLATLANPAAGFAMVVKKIGERAAQAQPQQPAAG